MGKVGRPKKDEKNVKSNIVYVRMTDEDLERLDSVAKGLKMTRSNALRTLAFEAENIIKWGL